MELNCLMLFDRKSTGLFIFNLKVFHMFLAGLPPSLETS